MDILAASNVNELILCDTVTVDESLEVLGAALSRTKIKTLTVIVNGGAPDEELNNYVALANSLVEIEIVDLEIAENIDDRSLVALANVLPRTTEMPPLISILDKTDIQDVHLRLLEDEDCKLLAELLPRTRIRKLDLLLDLRDFNSSPMCLENCRN